MTESFVTRPHVEEALAFTLADVRWLSGLLEELDREDPREYGFRIGQLEAALSGLRDHRAYLYRSVL